MPESDEKTTEPDEETWAPVPGYEGLYEVSDKGRVRSLDRPHQGGRVLAPDTSDAVPTVGLHREGNTVRRSIARLMMLAHGPDPDSPTMCAKRINPEEPLSTNNVEWRRPITQQKLTEQEAAVIYRAAWRVENDPTTTHDDIGKRYGVSRQTVSHIKNGRVWAHVTEDVNRPA